MELENLKEMWNEYDAKLEKSVKLNAGIWKEVKLDKSRSLIRRMAVSSTVELLINLALAVLLGSFIADNISVVRFLAPAAVLDVVAILLVASSVYQLSLVGQLDFTKPVTLTQKRLAFLRAHKIRVTKWILLISVLIWTPLLIVGLKAFFEADAYIYFSPTYLGSGVIAGVIVMLAAITLSKKYAGQLGRSPFVKKLMDDISGRNLTAAMALVQDIERFEKEDN